ILSLSLIFSFFFFNDTATTEIYTLSLHDALPISMELSIWYQGEFRNGIGSYGYSGDRNVGPHTHLFWGEAFLAYTLPELKHSFRSEEHTSELQSQSNLVCRLLLEKKKNKNNHNTHTFVRYAVAKPNKQKYR